MDARLKMSGMTPMGMGMGMDSQYTMFGMTASIGLHALKLLIIALRKLPMIASPYMDMVTKKEKTRCLSCIVLMASVLLLIGLVELGASQELEEDRFSAKFRQALKNWTGDWDGMVARNKVRVLVPFSKTFYFLDGGRQRGITYDLMKIFEKQINEDLKRKTVKVQFVFIPVNRDELIPDLLNGVGDIAAGALTITPNERNSLIFPNLFSPKCGRLSSRDLVLCN